MKTLSKSLLCLLLALLLTACTGDPANETTEAAGTDQTKQTEATDSATETTTQEQVPIVFPEAPEKAEIEELPSFCSARTLVEPYWEEQFTVSSVKDTAFYISIPQIHPFSEDAVACQQEIYQLFVREAEWPLLLLTEHPEQMERVDPQEDIFFEQDPYKMCYAYEAGYRQGVLSVVIRINCADVPRSNYYTYYLDVTTGKRLTQEEANARYAVDTDLLAETMELYYWQRHMSMDEKLDAYQDNLKKTLSNENIDGCRIFCAEDERLLALAHIYASGSEETVEMPMELDVLCRYLPETVENPDDLPVLKWVCLMQDQNTRTWSQEAAVEVNQMLADRELPFRIQFVLLTTEQDFLDCWKRFELPHVQRALLDADLIYARMGQSEMKTYLSPITEYVIGDGEPSLKNAATHVYDWLCGTIDGEVYGYRQNPILACADGWQIDPELMTAAGLTAEDFRRDYWEMDDVFAKLYAANGNRPFLYFNSSVFSQEIGDNGDVPGFIHISPFDEGLLPEYYDGICGFFAVDYSAETPVVVNTLEAELFSNTLVAANRYINAKYTTKDWDAARLVYTDLYTHSLGIYTDDNGKVCVPVTESYYSASKAPANVNGVAAASQHKEAAVSLLNLIAEDEEFRIRFSYGKEGRDYKLVDGYYEQIIQEDGSNYSMDFLSPLSYFCGLTESKESTNRWVDGVGNWHLSARDGKTSLQTYQEVLDHSVCVYNITFDCSEILPELKAMDAVFKEKYSPNIFRCTTEAQYQQLVEDMKACGSEKVLAELQRQLTEWQKNNPDWQRKPEG